MKVPFFIAKRYFFSKQSKSIVNIITWISILGLAVSTAAMVIVLSAFNGIETMVSKLYTDFDADISIHSLKSKTFPQELVAIENIHKLPEVASVSRVIEETVLLRKESKWVNATLYGVDSSFFAMTKMRKHLNQGKLPNVFANNTALVGIELLMRLDAFILASNPDQLLLYAPSRDAKISLRSSPFKTQAVSVIGALNYNRGINRQAIVLPYATADELLDYSGDITYWNVSLNDKSKLAEVQEKIQGLVGNQFLVKTNFEKNALIFKTSKIEKIIVFCILVFIFILATFNMVASLTMLFIEKKQNLKTLLALGLPSHNVFRIFFLQGVLICVCGILSGILLGYAVIALQLYHPLIFMPESGGEVFPVVAKVLDACLICLVTFSFGLLSTWFPVRILTKRFLKE